MTFKVTDAASHIDLPGIPTPRLIEAGGGPAFKRGEVWYLHEPGTMHVSPTGTYHRVIVRHLEPWTVDVSISVRDESVHDDELPEEYRDAFIVEAAGEQEAQSLAYTAAHEDVERRYGEGASSIVTILRARRGNHL